MAAWFGVFSVLLPVSASSATYNATPTFTGRAWYVPSAGAISGVGAVASVAIGLGKLNPWVNAGMIGLSLYHLAVQSQSSANIGIVAGNQLTTPIPGWANSDSPPLTAAPTATQSTTPATTTSGYCSRPLPATCGATMADVCETLRANTVAKAGTTPTSSLVSNKCTITKILQAYPLEDIYYIDAGTYKTCPAGATLSGSSCVSDVSCPVGYALVSGGCTLTDEPKVQWPADGQPTYVPRVGDNGVYQWWPADRDPDQGTYPQGNINAALQSGDVFTDPFGNPVTQTVTPTNDGGYVFQQQMQHTPSGSGNTYTTTNTMTVNNAGTIINISTVTNAGDITTVKPSTAAAVQPLPTDYNREATQAAIKEDLNKMLTGAGAQDAPDFQKDFEDKKTAMDKGITDFTDALPGQFAESKGNWFSWVWSPPVGQCSPYEGNIHGKSVSWNICPHIATARDLIGWLFALYGAWVVYNQMFRKED